MFYNALFRPSRLKAQLNNWSFYGGWFGTVILLNSWPKAKVWLRCLPWWGGATGIFWILTWPMLDVVPLIFLGLSLILIGWGLSVWSPAFALVFPLFLAFSLSHQPILLPVNWGINQAIFRDNLPADNVAIVVSYTFFKF